MLTLFCDKMRMTDSPCTSFLGASYFFTARLADQTSDLLVREIEHLRRATRGMLHRFPTRMDAVVVLPSVIHMIWTLPADDSQVDARWQMMKDLFVHAIPVSDKTEAARLHPRSDGIWQNGVRVQRLRSDEDFAAHRDLVLTAPVQYGLASSPTDWAHSSVHRDIAMGLQVPQTASAFIEHISSRANPVEQVAFAQVEDFGWGSDLVDDPMPLAASG